MSQNAAAPERIDLTREDDPRDVVHRAVACLAQGGLVGMPTEAVYGVVGAALDPGALGRLAGFAGGPRPASGALLVRGAGEVADWVPDAGPLALRLARRAWPGPVTLRVSGGAEAGLASRLPHAARALVAGEGSIALRSCAHPVLREVLRLLPGPLLLVEPDPAASHSPEPLASAGALDMLLDDGPTEWAGPPTRVAVSDQAWRVERTGVVDEADLARMAATLILFVCTGNTCRSPMAEAICKALIARRVGCPPDQLERHGYLVISAGVAAMHGMPAAGHAADVVAEWGGSLREHASRPATADLVRQADLIVAMTADHLDMLLERVPDVLPRARLLDPAGGDLADPIGTDRPNYLRTARLIDEYLQPLLAELGL